MMLGVMATSGESGGASGGSSELGASTAEAGGGGGGGNRWPRQETLALLKIRSDMDVAFRDSSLKAPLWDEVSRKLAELGFHRSAKKCKEKFENVFKYHKRTKDGRASKSDGKNYRFFDQLMALENAPPPPRPSAAAMPPHITSTSTVSSTSPTPLSVLPPIQTSDNPINSSPFQPPPLQAAAASNPPPPSHGFQPHFSTSSSSTSSDEDIQPRRGKKRKWKDFFQRLMRDVIHKQEELQKKFLDTLEKRERDRMAREESWRVQEMARMNREHDFLVQERSIAAAKDAAVIAFLHKVTEQNNLQIPIVATNIASPRVAMQPQPPINPQPPQQTPPPPPPLQLSALPSPVAPPPKAAATPTPTKMMDIIKMDNGGGGDNPLPASSSRWPKSEVQALIKLRTDLDIKYQENGPKGPLWEEISASMAKLGYNRSSKRCKEKWENINKYFKKVKESSKKRPEDSKTCPYFHQLDAIYRARAKSDVGAAAFNQGYAIDAEPIMARPEQQWPLPDQQNPAILPDHDHDNESDNNDHDEDDDGDDDDEEDEGGGYEIVTNKQPPSAANAAE